MSRFQEGVIVNWLQCANHLQTPSFRAPLPLHRYRAFCSQKHTLACYTPGGSTKKREVEIDMVPASQNLSLRGEISASWLKSSVVSCAFQAAGPSSGRRSTYKERSLSSFLSLCTLSNFICGLENPSIAAVHVFLSQSFLWKNG